jgi:hypothetical protein
MTIFDLHASVLADYRDFVRSFIAISDSRARAFVDRALLEEGRLWPDFLLQVGPASPRNIRDGDPSAFLAGLKA